MGWSASNAAASLARLGLLSGLGLISTAGILEKTMSVEESCRLNHTQFSALAPTHAPSLGHIHAPSPAHTPASSPAHTPALSPACAADTKLPPAISPQPQANFIIAPNLSMSDLLTRLIQLKNSIKIYSTIFYKMLSNNSEKPVF